MNTDSSNNEERTPEGVDAIRADIESTRSELSTTIDAIEAKLNPQRVKERVTETVRDATVSKAIQVRDKVTAAAAPAVQAIQETVKQRSNAKSASSDGSQSTLATKTNSPLKPIAEQVVVVFGASSGIGRETALQFARRGARVVVAARGQDELDSLVVDIGHAGGQAVAQVADVADFEQVKAVADRAVAEYGRLDTWVHLAAISIYGLFEQVKPEEFGQIIDTNLVGAARGALAAMPHLRREGRGALIVISSVEGKRALPYQSAYSASKHGIIGFLDSLRLEIMRDDVPISVTNVMPSGINTPFFNKAKTRLGVKPMPVPPIYQPSVVAEVILYAAEHPTRDIVAGGGGKALLAMQRFAPGIMDRILVKTGFQGQKTNEVRSDSDPDNLYQHLDGFGRIGGDFSNQAKDKSLGNWLETHPLQQRLLKGATLLALLMYVRRK